MKYMKHAKTGHIHAVPDNAKLDPEAYAEEATKEEFDAEIAAFKAATPEPLIGGPASFLAGADADGKVVVNVGSPLPEGFEPTELPEGFAAPPTKEAAAPSERG